MHPPHRLLLGFSIRLVVIYTLLILLWPVIHQPYADAYRAVGTFVFGSVFSGGRVWLKPVEGQDRKDTAIGVLRLDVNRGGTHVHRTRISGYIPTATLTALVLATPIPWRRRLRALGWGWLFVNLFIALRLWLTLLACFCEKRAFGLYDPSPFWREVLTAAHQTIAVLPTTSYLVPVLIWAVVTFRRSDWTVFLNPSAKAEPVSSAGLPRRRPPHGPRRRTRR